MPSTMIPGSSAVAYADPRPIGASKATPVPATTGPTVMGRRYPIRDASLPARGESTSIRTVIGVSAAPDASGEYSRTRWSCSTNRNVAPPRAKYTATVTAFAPENWRDRNKPRGSMGS